MKHIRTIVVLLIVVLSFSSCNRSINNQQTPTNTQTTETPRNPEITYNIIADCYSEEEYTAFLNSDQCPAQYVTLDAFDGFGSFKFFRLCQWIDRPDCFWGYYEFDCNGAEVYATFRLQSSFSVDFDRHGAMANVQEINKEDMPEDFDVGKPIEYYWAERYLEQQGITEPTEYIDESLYHKGHYYEINSDVRLLCTFSDDYNGPLLFHSFGNYLTVLLDVAPYQFWIVPMNLSYDGIKVEDEYDVFREACPLMDRLFTKSTCEEAADELIKRFYANVKTRS